MQSLPRFRRSASAALFGSLSLLCFYAVSANVRLQVAQEYVKSTVISQLNRRLIRLDLGTASANQALFGHDISDLTLGIQFENTGSTVSVNSEGNMQWKSGPINVVRISGNFSVYVRAVGNPTIGTFSGTAKISEMQLTLAPVYGERFDGSLQFNSKVCQLGTILDPKLAFSINPDSIVHSYRKTMADLVEDKMKDLCVRSMVVNVLNEVMLDLLPIKVKLLENIKMDIDVRKISTVTDLFELESDGDTYFSANDRYSCAAGSTDCLMDWPAFAATGKPFGIQISERFLNDLAKSAISADIVGFSVGKQAYDSLGISEWLSLDCEGYGDCIGAILPEITGTFSNGVRMEMKFIFTEPPTFAIRDESASMELAASLFAHAVEESGTTNEAFVVAVKLGVTFTNLRFSFSGERQMLRSRATVHLARLNQRSSQIGFLDWKLLEEIWQAAAVSMIEPYLNRRLDAGISLESIVSRIEVDNSTKTLAWPVLAFSENTIVIGGDINDA